MGGFGCGLVCVLARQLAMLAGSNRIDPSPLLSPVSSHFVPPRISAACMGCWSACRAEQSRGKFVVVCWIVVQCPMRTKLVAFSCKFTSFLQPRRPALCARTQGAWGGMA